MFIALICFLRWAMWPWASCFICRGHVVLIVNVASKWGFTDKNYTQLQKLHEKYAEEKGLRILGFPCNQFGSQVEREREREDANTKGILFWQVYDLSVWSFLSPSTCSEEWHCVLDNLDKLSENIKGNCNWIATLILLMWING